MSSDKLIFIDSSVKTLFKTDSQFGALTKSFVVTFGVENWNFMRADVDHEFLNKLCLMNKQYPVGCADLDHLDFKGIHFDACKLKTIL